MDILELEERYLKAKEAYYTGEPIISDDEFDRLEEELKSLSSDVVTLVGTADRNFKHPHLSPMLSLAKAQAALDGTPPFEQMQSWFSSFSDDIKFDATPKYDGNAINLVYRKGKFKKAITRGDKSKGRDVTEKLIRKVPLFLDGITTDVEVRGEVMMPDGVFNEKYSKDFKNPRNFIAGVLNRDEIDIQMLDEIVFMALEVRIHDGDYDYPENTHSWLWTHGFNRKDEFFRTFTPSEFGKVYDEMLNYRINTSPFQLDGFVIKTQEDVRRSLGESGHSPNWAIAVKFPPKEAITRVKSIRWSVGTTGEITPVAEMDPIDLDGTIVKNAAVFNVGHIQKMGIFPGAIVAVAKSGDIIPQIVRVITPVYDGELPTSCPCGKAGVIQEGIHLYCASEVCETQTLKKFMVGLGVFKLDKFGGVTRRTLFESGYDEIWKIFDRSIFCEEKLIETGNFKSGKTLTSLLNEVDKIKTVTLAQVILSLGFDGIGSTAAKQLAKFIRGTEYSFSGLEKAAVAGFEDGTTKREKVEHLVKVLQDNGITIEEEVVLKDGIGYELTGKPFQTDTIKIKADFEKIMLKHGYIYTGIKEATYLITDNMNSSSSKMKIAKKMGIEIITYEEILKKAGEI